MFNLFRSREKSVRIILTVMLGLVALSMVTYLVPQTGNGYDTASDPTVVARVGKETITKQDVQRQIQNLTRNRQLPPELLSVYVPQIIQQMITERTMEYEAGQLGLKVSDQEADAEITNTLPAELFKDGKLDSATLSQVLAQQGITFSDMRSQTARQLLVNKLQQIISQGNIVTPADIEAEYKHRNDKVKLAYVLLAPAKYQAESTPTEAELKAYYDAHKAEFTIPEKRSYAIIVLDPAKVAASINVTDAQLQAEYNSRRNDFQTPERVKVRHILVKADASNDAVQKAKAEGLLKQLKAGADFSKLAKENSDDPGSKDQGGELNWVTRGQMVPEFEQATFATPVGQLSGLVKTTYGYHILQVEAHEQARLQPFDEVKGQLAADYQRRLAQDKMQSLADRAVAELRKDPAHPEKAAEAVGSSVVTADKIEAGDPIPGVGVSKEFTDATAALRKGEVTAGPVVLQDGRALVATVTDVVSSHPANFDEARTQVSSKASQDKLSRIISDKANELMTKVQAMNGDLEGAAKALKLEVKTSSDVDRQGAIESVGTASSIPEAFTKPVGSVIGPLQVTGGRFIGKVISKTPADMANLAAQSATIRTDLRQQRSRDRAQFFQDGLRARLKAEKKLVINQDIINSIVQQYQRS
jgi:peptidyl-prolyl cis-trans isomerase D